MSYGIRLFDNSGFVRMDLDTSWMKYLGSVTQSVAYPGSGKRVCYYFTCPVAYAGRKMVVVVAYQDPKRVYSPYYECYTHALVGTDTYAWCGSASMSLLYDGTVTVHFLAY